jgi:tetratricopeptide (TPR) repeat protein
LDPLTIYHYLKRVELVSFLRKLFGNSDPLDPLRRARSRSAWAELLARGEEFDLKNLDGAVREELEALLCEAGDSLAEINLFEMEACLRGGDTERAAEHLSLAAAQARSDSMRLRISKCQIPVSGTSAVPLVTSSLSCSGGCAPGNCTPAEPGSEGDELDDFTRLELILSSYPSAWRERYLAMGSDLRSAFFLSHEGMEKEALQSFGLVEEAERDDLFLFERGTLLARMGDKKGAVRDLREALSRNPDHLLAQKTLIDLELSAGETASAESRLRALLSSPEANAFCHGRLCAIEANRRNIDKAIEHGLLAVPGGDPQVLILTASLLENVGRLGEAEALLNKLPGGGCSGPSLALAEFWVRHSLNPDKALGAFKGALRQDPENPRWLLRIAQIYSNRGWKKEAVPLLEGLLSGAAVDGELAQEAKELLITCRTNGNA